MITARFQSTGTLREDSLYIERSADAQLLSALEAGEFCYVLGQRQIGKSSLRSRTERRLRERGVRTVHIDLTALGSEATAPEWYYALISSAAEQLDLEDAARAHWAATENSPPVQRWASFLRRVLLVRVPSRIVIFIDEIDKTLALPFPRDDFFAGLRALFNARVDEPALGRLTFCVLGSVAHQDLMSDVKQTPFNIGRAVELGDFTWQEVQALRPGLAAISQDPDTLLRAIFAWTDGHPYMTQRLCEVLQSRGSIAPGEDEQQVVGAVRRTFLWRGLEDPSLGHAAKFFFSEGRRPPHALAAEMLALHRELLRAPVEVLPDDVVQRALWFTGMAARRRLTEPERGPEQGPDRPVLTVRNRVFREMFDDAWIDKVSVRLQRPEPPLRLVVPQSAPALVPLSPVGALAPVAAPAPVSGPISSPGAAPAVRAAPAAEAPRAETSVSITSAGEAIPDGPSVIHSQLMPLPQELRSRPTAANPPSMGRQPGGKRGLAWGGTSAALLSALIMVFVVRTVMYGPPQPLTDGSAGCRGDLQGGLQARLPADLGTHAGEDGIRSGHKDMRAAAAPPSGPQVTPQVTKKSFVLFIEPKDAGKRGQKPAAAPKRALLVDRETITNGEFVSYLNSAQSDASIDANGRVLDDGHLVIDLTRSRGIRHKDGAFVVSSEQADEPVLGVSAYGAKDYCRTRRARLPTVEQWLQAESKVQAQHPEMVRSEGPEAGAPKISVIERKAGPGGTGSGIARPKSLAVAPPAGFRCVLPGALASPSQSAVTP
jgi:hypothetical protein